MEFTGDPTPLSNEDYSNAAQKLNCTVAAIKAVAEVESAGGGFMRDGRPKILFERHIFHRQSKGKFTDTHPDISFPSGGGYLGGSREYDRLEEAMKLDKQAALKSASWGKFQVMGFNHDMVGEAEIEEFVRKMVSGEPAQLAYFVAFIKRRGLDDELRRLDWRGFARGYNGPAFERFQYDRKIARAFAKYSDGGSRTDNPTPMLKIGDSGQAVRHVQELLGLVPDGDFGPVTKNAVIEFQKDKGLHPDGIVGQVTWTQLLENSRLGGIQGAKRTRPPLREGDRGDIVKFLQELLKLPADGIFGSGTQAAVIKFQESNGLTADGIVGAMTWDALLA